MYAANTQSTLNTFHKAGQSTKQVTVGVPRFNELLNCTKNPKIVNCKIFFKNGNKTVQELRETISYNFVCLTLKDISKSIEVKIDKEYEDWYDTYKIVYNDKFASFSNCISIKLDYEIMYKYRLNIMHIVKIIESEYDDLHCVFSPLDKERLDIFVDVSNIQFTEDRLLFVTPENAHEIYLEECVQPILEKITICGIPGITSIFYTNDNGEWYIETEGSNFKKLLGNDIIDMTRLQSNNVWDIYNTLGIEASREFLIQEFSSIMEGINTCHVKLLVEKMTYSGTISSISRYTLRKDESGPMAKASFEESTDNYIKAAFNCDLEKIHGVSASIICGKRAKLGTGFMDLKININQLKNAIPVFLDKNNEGVVKDQKSIPKIKPYPYTKL
jgi:DNA-directed RNA polymerase beta' subunit